MHVPPGNLQILQVLQRAVFIHTIASPLLVFLCVYGIIRKEVLPVSNEEFARKALKAWEISLGLGQIECESLSRDVIQGRISIKEGLKRARGVGVKSMEQAMERVGIPA